MTPGRTLAFGRFRLDAEARLLYRDDERLSLTPKAVDVLVALIEARGRALGRAELLRTVWSDTAVEDGTRTSHFC